MQNLIVEALLLILLIFTAISTMGAKDLLASAVIYGAFSFFAVLIYLMLGAPDVAFTEAVIGVISTVFFLAALKSVNRWCKR